MKKKLIALNNLLKRHFYLIPKRKWKKILIFIILHRYVFFLFNLFIYPLYFIFFRNNNLISYDKKHLALFISPIHPLLFFISYYVYNFLFLFFIRTLMILIDLGYIYFNYSNIFCKKDIFFIINFLIAETFFYTSFFVIVDLLNAIIGAYNEKKNKKIKSYFLMKSRHAFFLLPIFIIFSISYYFFNVSFFYNVKIFSLAEMDRIINERPFKRTYMWIWFINKLLFKYKGPNYFHFVIYNIVLIIIYLLLVFLIINNFNPKKHKN